MPAALLLPLSCPVTPAKCGAWAEASLCVLRLLAQHAHAASQQTSAAAQRHHRHPHTAHKPTLQHRRLFPAVHPLEGLWAGTAASTSFPRSPGTVRARHDVQTLTLSVH